MRRPVVLVLCSLLLASSATGDEKSPGRARPLSVQQAADALAAAGAAKDAKALATLAAAKRPDPWLVTDELAQRGAWDVATAFAAGVRGPDVEKLPGHVTALRTIGDEREYRALLQTLLTALRAGKPAEVEAAAAALPAEAGTVTAVRLLHLRGTALVQLRKPYGEEVLRRGALAALQIGWLQRAARLYRDAGMAAYRRSAWSDVLVSWRAQLAIDERRGNQVGAAATLGNLGLVHESLGQFRKALELHQRAHAAQKALNNEFGAARVLGYIGNVHTSLGDYAKALETLGRAWRAMDAAGDKAGAAGALTNMGIAYEHQGDYPKALDCYERALPSMEAIGDKVSAATTLGNLGTVHHLLGDLPKALSLYERAHGAKLALGDRAGAAALLGNIGGIQHRLGDYERALETQERARAAKAALDDKAGAAQSLASIAGVQRSMGNHSEALALYQRALAAFEALDDKPQASIVRGQIGATHLRLGDIPQAESVLKRALSEMEALGNRGGVIGVLGSLGTLHRKRGALGQALTTYERARALLRDTPDPHGHVRVLEGLAALHMLQGDPASAVLAVQEGLSLTTRMAARLAAGEAARARDTYVSLYELGVRAASAAGDVSALSSFLEQGRAGSLREGLGSRGALEAAVIPAPLRSDLALARHAERAAIGRVGRAQRSGSLRRLRAARKVLDAAQGRVVEVFRRLRREAKAAAALTLADPDELARIQGYLGPSEALLLYGATPDSLLVLVVRRASARVVALGKREAVESALAALFAGGEQHVAPEAVAGLRKLLITPLELDPAATRVLVSPIGRLGYVPFALLLPGREIAYMPSGTTLGLLQAESVGRKNSGTQVLALGDPDYDGKQAAAMQRAAARGALTRLPATRAEVEAIGTTRMLGPEASESGLYEALRSQARWRALHLACHGLVDPEQPLLSALALTPDEHNDGFLSALEIYPLRVPADLVVLSACETGKGTIFKTEGIVGLTRAFMFAGAPRVLCSLWKVDDEATQALMIKFYELWNPSDATKGLGVAAALKQAQAHVRSHDKWRHPYYWAAWVLWGLPV